MKSLPRGPDPQPPADFTTVHPCVDLSTPIVLSEAPIHASSECFDALVAALSALFRLSLCLLLTCLSRRVLPSPSKDFGQCVLEDVGVVVDETFLVFSLVVLDFGNKD